jgi:glycogen debranching enzyme
MDNQPRLPPGFIAHIDHGHMSWIDANAQAAFSAQILLAMARTLDRLGEVRDLSDEVQALQNYVNRFMWDDQAGFYGDRRRDGGISPVKTIGAYWTLLAGIVPTDRLDRFVGHLRNPALFNRPHRIPALAADHPKYTGDGGYWCGGVWPSTNYMVLRGLTQNGYDDLAYEIGLNHVNEVVKVFQSTGTLWENYAPESAAPGQPAKGDFVGWGGLGPIAVFLEYVLGIRADVPNASLRWDIRNSSEHGVRRYPYGAGGLLDLHVQGRSDSTAEPKVKIQTNVPLTLTLTWPGGGRRTLQVAP